MGHVGSEMLDIVHAMPQRLAHVRDGASQKSDLVGPRRQARNLDFASSAHPDPVGRERKPSERPNDGSRKEQRQEHGDEDRQAHRDEE